MTRPSRDSSHRTAPESVTPRASAPPASPPASSPPAPRTSPWSSTTGRPTTPRRVFTANRCKANPILWSQEVVKDGVVRAVVLNSGGANCYTGPDGFQTTHAVAERVAERLGIGAIDVVVCSTGLIGLANDRQQLLDGVDAAYAGLGDHGGGRRPRRS